MWIYKSSVFDVVFLLKQKYAWACGVSVHLEKLAVWLPLS